MNLDPRRIPLDEWLPTILAGHSLKVRNFYLNLSPFAYVFRLWPVQPKSDLKD